MYIGLQPIDEGAIDVGIADEDTDGCLGHQKRGLETRPRSRGGRKTAHPFYQAS